MTILKKSYNDLLAEIEALKAQVDRLTAERDDWKRAFHEVNGSDDATADSFNSFNEYYLAQQSGNEPVIDGKWNGETSDGFIHFVPVVNTIPPKAVCGKRIWVGGWHDETDMQKCPDCEKELNQAQAGDDAFDTSAFVYCDALAELKAELTDITEPIPYMDDDGEVA